MRREKYAKAGMACRLKARRVDSTKWSTARNLSRMFTGKYDSERKVQEIEQ
jgi:hypothetical protein